MKTKITALLVMFGMTTQAQWIAKMGILSQDYDMIEMSIQLDEINGRTHWFDMPKGGAFLTPIQLGLSAGGEHGYDVGLGLQLGSMQLTDGGVTTKSKVFSPHFFVEYYIINKWYPLQFGLGATVSYNKTQYERQVSYAFDPDYTQNEYNIESRFGGIGYGITLLGRYWLGQKEKMALQVGYGNRADWLTVKDLKINGAQIALSETADNRLDVEGMFYQVSLVGYFGRGSKATGGDKK